jgi:hypothetical protein
MSGYFGFDLFELARVVTKKFHRVPRRSLPESRSDLPDLQTGKQNEGERQALS